MYGLARCLVEMRVEGGAAHVMCETATDGSNYYDKYLHCLSYPQMMIDCQIDVYFHLDKKDLILMEDELDASPLLCPLHCRL